MARKLDVPVWARIQASGVEYHPAYHELMRVAVEHGIGKMKIWRIAAERYRNPLRRHTLIIKNVAGLHNMVFA